MISTFFLIHFSYIYVDDIFALIELLSLEYLDNFFAYLNAIHNGMGCQASCIVQRFENEIGKQRFVPSRLFRSRSDLTQAIEISTAKKRGYLLHTQIFLSFKSLYSW